MVISVNLRGKIIIIIINFLFCFTSFFSDLQNLVLSFRGNLMISAVNSTLDYFLRGLQSQWPGDMCMSNQQSTI